MMIKDYLSPNTWGDTSYIYRTLDAGGERFGQQK